MLEVTPLSHQDLEKIEATHLSMIDQHYLRLLAHCLYTFKLISKDASYSDGALPDEQLREEWLFRQPQLTKEKDFIKVLLSQLNVAGLRLDQLASCLDKRPLELTLDNLIDFALTNSWPPIEKGSNYL